MFFTTIKKCIKRKDSCKERKKREGRRIEINIFVESCSLSEEPIIYNFKNAYRFLFWLINSSTFSSRFLSKAGENNRQIYREISTGKTNFKRVGRKTKKVENIMLSEKSQTQKVTFCIIPFI